MKKFLFVVVFVFAGSLVFAQERIAVFPFEDMENVLTRNQMDAFYQEFSTELANRSAGRFIPVLRQDFERLIDKETAFQLSDYSSPEKTAEMESVLNATKILSGRIIRVGDSIRITVSLYTFPGLMVLPGGTTLSVANTDELFTKIPELVQRMQKEIAASAPKPPIGTGGKIGYGALNLVFGLGAYIQGDIASGVIMSVAEAAGLGLIIWEITGFEYNDKGAGVPGTVGLFTIGASVIYGFIQPFIYRNNPRLANITDNVHIGFVPGTMGNLSVSLSFRQQF